MEDEKPKEPEKPKELEEDAAEAVGPRISPEDVAFGGADSTLNVMPTMGGRLLLGLTEGGLQHLLAGTRASVGLKSGRYMVEVKIVEITSRDSERGSDWGDRGGRGRP